MPSPYKWLELENDISLILQYLINPKNFFDDRRNFASETSLHRDINKITQNFNIENLKVNPAYCRQVFKEILSQGNNRAYGLVYNNKDLSIFPFIKQYFQYGLFYGKTYNFVPTQRHEIKDFANKMPIFVKDWRTNLDTYTGILHQLALIYRTICLRCRDKQWNDNLEYLLKTTLTDLNQTVEDFLEKMNLETLQSFKVGELGQKIFCFLRNKLLHKDNDLHKFIKSKFFYEYYYLPKLEVGKPFSECALIVFQGIKFRAFLSEGIVNRVLILEMPQTNRVFWFYCYSIAERVFGLISQLELDQRLLESKDFKIRNLSPANRYLLKKIAVNKLEPTYHKFHGNVIKNLNEPDDADIPIVTQRVTFYRKFAMKTAFGAATTLHTTDLAVYLGSILLYRLPFGNLHSFNYLQIDDESLSKILIDEVPIVKLIQKNMLMEYLKTDFTPRFREDEIDSLLEDVWNGIEKNKKQPYKFSNVDELFSLGVAGRMFKRNPLQRKEKPSLDIKDIFKRDEEVMLDIAKLNLGGIDILSFKEKPDDDLSIRNMISMYEEDYTLPEITEVDQSVIEKKMFPVLDTSGIDLNIKKATVSSRVEESTIISEKGEPLLDIGSQFDESSLMSMFSFKSKKDAENIKVKNKIEGSDSGLLELNTLDVDLLTIKEKIEPSKTIQRSQEVKSEDVLNEEIQLPEISDFSLASMFSFTSNKPKNETQKQKKENKHDDILKVDPFQISLDSSLNLGTNPTTDIINERKETKQLKERESQPLTIPEQQMIDLSGIDLSLDMSEVKLDKKTKAIKPGQIKKEKSPQQMLDFSGISLDFSTPVTQDNTKVEQVRKLKNTSIQSSTTIDLGDETEEKPMALDLSGFSLSVSDNYGIKDIKERKHQSVPSKQKTESKIAKVEPKKVKIDDVVMESSTLIGSQFKSEDLLSLFSFKPEGIQLDEERSSLDQSTDNILSNLGLTNDIQFVDNRLPKDHYNEKFETERIKFHDVALEMAKEAESGNLEIELGREWMMLNNLPEEEKGELFNAVPLYEVELLESSSSSESDSDTPVNLEYHQLVPSNELFEGTYRFEKRAREAMLPLCDYLTQSWASSDIFSLLRHQKDLGNYLKLVSNVLSHHQQLKLTKKEKIVLKISLMKFKEQMSKSMDYFAFSLRKTVRFINNKISFFAVQPFESRDKALEISNKKPHFRFANEIMNINLPMQVSWVTAPLTQSDLDQFINDEKQECYFSKQTPFMNLLSNLLPKLLIIKTDLFSNYGFN